MTMEKLIDQSGGMNKFQILVIVGVYLHKLSSGWSMLQMSYAGSIPDWYCVSGHDKNNATYYTNQTYERCSINTSYTGYKEKDCQSHHFGGPSKTVISEWDLVCDLKWVKATMTAVQMAGVMLGAVASGQLADMFGRKKSMYGFSLFHSLLNFGAAFSTSWEMFAVFRFVIGFGIGGIIVVSLPYPMEFLPTKWRPVMGILPDWAISVGLFAGSAYFLDNWAYVHIACGAVSLPALLGYFYIPESVRWLTLKGRYEEAEKIIDQMAIVNGKEPPKETRAVLEQLYKDEQESRAEGKKYTYWDLFKGRKQIIVSFVFGFMWASLSLVYYGISFGVSSLSGNLYVNIFLLAIVEIPAQLSTFYLSNKFGRKSTCIAFMVLVLIGAIGCVIVFQVLSADSRGEWVTGLSLIAKMGTGASWIVSAVWVSEYYPTVIRNLGYGMVNTAARVGSISAPFLIDFDNAPLVAYAIITVLTAMSIALAFLVPDTKDMTLPDCVTNKSSAVNHNDGGHMNNVSIQADVKIAEIDNKSSNESFGEKVDIVIEKNGGIVPVKNDDIVPVKNGDTVPVENGDIVPVKNDDIVSVKNGDIVPVKNGDIVPVKNDDIFPVKNGDIVPVKNDDIVSVKNGDIVPEKNGDTVTEKNGDIVPEKNGHIVTEKNGDIGQSGDSEKDDTTMGQNSYYSYLRF